MYKYTQIYRLKLVPLLSFLLSMCIECAASEEASYRGLRGIRTSLKLPLYIGISIWINIYMYMCIVYCRLLFQRHIAQCLYIYTCPRQFAIVFLFFFHLIFFNFFFFFLYLRFFGAIYTILHARRYYNVNFLTEHYSTSTYTCKDTYIYINLLNINLVYVN